MSKRNHSIDLLKVIAIFLIIVSHAAMSTIGAQGIADENINFIILNILRYCGTIGNILFIICSAFFLINSNVSKKEKILCMIMDTFLLSMLGIIPFLFFNIKISTKDLIKQFAPITFANNWFIDCYLMFYLIHPYLNIIINKCEQKELLRINLILIVLYSCIQFVLLEKFYFNLFIEFIYIYFLISYMKKYMINFQKNIKINFILFIFSLLINTLLILITNYLGLNISFFSNKVLHWNNLANPLIIVLCITLFNLFNNFNFNFKTKIISYISSLSLLIYLIHENMLFRTYIRPLFYPWFSKYCSNILVQVLVLSVILFIASTILSAIYKETLQKLTKLLSKKIKKYFSSTYLKIEKSLLNIK